MPIMSTGSAGSAPRDYGFKPPADPNYVPDGTGSYRFQPTNSYASGPGYANALPNNPIPQPFASALSGLSSAFSSGSASPSSASTGQRPAEPASAGAASGALPFMGAGSPYTPPGGGGPHPLDLPAHPNLPAPINFSSGPGADQLKANNDAIYANAKDEAGNTAQAAMTALQGQLQGRGMGGAGYEAGQIGNTVNREANQIGQVTRQRDQTQYDQALARANTIDQMSLGQRGQDIGALDSLYNTDVGATMTGRGQDISKYGIDTNANLTARGQDLGKYSTDVNAATARSGQGISQYGIDMGAYEQDQSRAQQERLAQQQALLGLLKGAY